MPSLFNLSPYSKENRHRTLFTAKRYALFVFESSPNLDPNTAPRIHRFYKTDHCYSPMDDGKLIGHGLSSKSAMLIKAGAGDLIAITERLSGSLQLHWRYYRVGRDSEIIPLDPHNRKLTRDEINRILRTDDKNSEPLLVENIDIATMFAQPQPHWLQEILEAQLVHWHQHNLSNYYKHTKRRLTRSELQRCVDFAPYQALAKWKSKLCNAQYHQAIRTSSEGAVRFAIRDIPAYLREGYLQQHASWALQDAAALSGAELARCAKDDSKSALRIRFGLSPKRRAIALANSYYVFWSERNDEILKEFRLEVLDSISAYPLVWIAAHGGDFGKLVKELQLYLSLELTGAALTGLLVSSDHSVSATVAAFISSRV